LRARGSEIVGATRIAVLPFLAPPTDAEATALADSLTEDITTGLGRFSYLSVVPPQSVERFKAGGSDIRRARDAMGARYVLDGSVRRLGNQARVTTRLVDTTSEQQLWSETYDRDVAASTALAILDDVTDRIVATVADVYGVLLRSMSQGLLERPLDTLDVDEVLLRYWCHERQPEPAEHALLRGRLEQLVEEHAHQADAWAALANLYCQELMHGFNPLDDSLGRAQRAVMRAIDLDATNQHGWHTLAIARYFAGDRDGFVHAAERALSINPRNTRTMAFLAFLFSQLGETDRACAMTERAMAINPAYPGWYHFVFFDRHYVRGEYGDALAAARRINMPKNLWSHWAVAVSAGQLGRAADAAAALDGLFALAPATANEGVLEAIVARWRWNKPENVAVTMEGFRKAVALRDALRKTPTDAVTARPLSTAAPRPASGVSRASIAVLPFTDLSPEKNQDWFCDGMAEEILNALTQLPGLHVAARTSAFSFRNQGEDLRALADKLGVATVLQGSVRRAGDRIRVTVQLVDVSNGFQLWSDRYDRELKDIFDVQDEIARAIADRLSVTLASDGRRLVPKVTANLEAYELLLQGRTLLTRRGRAILDALPCFERAVMLDPSLAEAHALLGDAYRLLGLYGLAPATEMMPRARAAVERALALDPAQVEALATLANIAAVYDWDIAAARAFSDRALASDPSHVRALAERAIVLTIVDSPPTELEQHVLESVSRARTIDPLNAWAWAVESYCLALTNHPVEAIANAQHAVALDAENFSARWIHVWTLAAAGRFDEAVAAAEPALAMSGRSPRILTELAAICAARGDQAGAQAIYGELRTRAATSFIGSAEQASAAAAAGHLEAARALVARAIDMRDTYLVFWKLPAWAPFRRDPEGMALIRQAGITDMKPRTR
jgi:serine/threonine-protein kinase